MELPWMPAGLHPRIPLEVSGFVCALCRGDAHHNEVLRISYCQIHGLSAPLTRVRGVR